MNIPEGQLVLMSADPVPSAATRQTDLVRDALLERGHRCEVWRIIDRASRRSDRDFLLNLGTWRKRLRDPVRYVDVRGWSALPYLAALTVGRAVIPKITLSVEGGPPSKMAALPRRAMRRISQIATSSPQSVEAWRRVWTGPIHVLPPLVRPPGALPSSDDASVELPRVVVRANLEELEPVRTAIWNFDILKYAFPLLRLQVLGAGPKRAELEEFARSLGRDDTRVDFLGEPDDLEGVLRRAMLIWVGSPGESCPYALAEALAAGRTTIGWDHPEHRAFDSSALLADPADRIGLAKLSQPLLERPLDLALRSERVREIASDIDTSASVREYVRVVGPSSAT